MEIELTLLISLLGTIVGGVIGVLGYRRTASRDSQNKARDDAILKADIENIKASITNLSHEQSILIATNSAVKERIIRLEEAVKQVEYRIERLEKCKDDKAK